MEPPSDQQQEKPHRSNTRTKTTIADTYYANCKLIPIPRLDGKFKLDVTKIEEQELVNPPQEEKNSRLFGWQVEVRRRANGKNHDKFYSHIKSGVKFRSTPEVIDYILHGKPKNENAKKPGRAPKRSRREEDEANTDSHPAENDEKDESLSWGSPRELPTSFYANLNQAVKNEYTSLMTSLGGNNVKGISIHHQEPVAGGLQSKVSSSGNLRVEGKGKGILIEEDDVEKRSVFGIHGGMFSPQPYTCANFQTPTLLQGWSMGGSWNNSLDMGMNGTTFGSSNLSMDSNPSVVANPQNDNQVPAPHGICTNTLPGNMGDAKMDMDSGSLFDFMPSQAEMDELMSFIYSDIEEEKEEEVEGKKEEKAVEDEAVQGTKTDLATTFHDIVDDEPIVDIFCDKYGRD